MEHQPVSDAKRLKLVKKEPSEDADISAYEDTSGIAWKLCCKLDEAERLAIKENAVEHAEQHGDLICNILKKAIQEAKIPQGENNHARSLATTLERWMDSIQQVKSKNRAYEALVGVAGSTGAGKSSILNAILGVYEMLPSGQEGAATSASCKVMWNYDDRPEYQCKAEIQFLPKEDVIQMLLNTLEAMKAQYDHDNKSASDDEEEAEYLDEADENEAEIREGMNKIASIWQRIEEDVMAIAANCEDDKDFERAANEIFESNKDVVDMIESGTKFIHSPDPQSLADQIKPFLDSSSANHGTCRAFAAWPLIRNVNVFLRQDVLKFGVCLVDLPGIADSVVSRGKVAKDFYSQLHVTLIVAAVHRASSEQAAHGLMTEYQAMQMKMEGRFNAKRLGVVLSKCDDLKIDSYIRSKSLANDTFVQDWLARRSSAKSQIMELQKQEKRLQQYIESIGKKQAKIEKRMQRIANQRSTHKHSQGQSSHNETISSANRDKKLQTILDTLLEQKNEMTDQLSQGKMDIEKSRQKQVACTREISMADEILAHWAISTRNKHVGAQIQKDFQQRMARNNAEQTEEPLLSIIPTSARAYWDVSKGEGHVPGLPGLVYSGVPLVRHWIHQATASKREDHLDMILNMYDAEFDAIHGWCNINSTKQETISLTKEDVVAALTPIHEKYSQETSTLFDTLHKEIMLINPLEDASKIQRYFKLQSGNVARHWSDQNPDDKHCTQRMRFPTYGALLKRQGGPWRSSNGIEYDWLPRLAVPLYKELVNTWDHKLNRDMPALLEPFKLVVSQLWTRYMADMVKATHKLDLELSQDLKDTRGDLMNRRHMIFTGIKNLLDGFSKDTSGCHSEILETFKTSMTIIFREAANIKGKGTYERQRKLVEHRVRKISSYLFEAAWERLCRGLDEKKRETRKVLETISQAAILAVKLQIDMLMDRFLDSDRVPWTAAQKQVQHDVRECFRAWQMAWQFPSPEKNHTVYQDVAIPEVLRPDDLVMIKDENQEDEADTDSAASTSDIEEIYAQMRSSQLVKREDLELDG